MAYRVETTARAERDADRLLGWLIAQRAGETGLRWFEGLEEAIATLADMPERCPFAPENARVPFEVRQLLYGRRPNVYRILFTIEGGTVYILHILHGRRRPLTRLAPPH
jgi:plasmid stabilization system protein ParE